MIYEYRGPGAPKNIPAAVAGAELTRIAHRDGGILPRVVVNESEPLDAPLHSAFEWNNDTAAEGYRIEQARRLVRSVVLVPQPERNETAPVVRAFVSIYETTNTRHYKPMLDVLASPVEAAQVKSRLRNELLALRRRYLDLIEMDEGMRQAFDMTEQAVA